VGGEIGTEGNFRHCAEEKEGISRYFYFTILHLFSRDDSPSFRNKKSE
jgi:hypothetical protein